MTIGLAIVIAAVLFLIDRNHVWPQVWRGVKRATKICVEVVVVGVVVGTVLWGGDRAYDLWAKHRQERAEAAAEKAEEQRHATEVHNMWSALNAIEPNVCGSKLL